MSEPVGAAGLGARVGWGPGCSWVLQLPRDPSAGSSSSVQGGDEEKGGDKEKEECSSGVIKVETLR